MNNYGYNAIKHLEKMEKEANIGRRDFRQIEKAHKKNKRKGKR